MNNIKTRMGIFLMRDLKGEVNDYVEYLLKDITQNMDRLIVVCNGGIKVCEKIKLEKYTEEIIERADVGFDFGGWQDAIINYLGFEDIRRYDELILFNDSIFGPLYPFEDVFNAIDDRFDFWGLSVHGETNNVYGMCPYGYRPRYLQTYFLAIRNRMLSCEEFESFWKNLPQQNDFKAVGEKISCVFTKYFEDLGFKWCALCDTSDLDSTREKAMSYHTFNLYDMVVRRGFPVIKRKTFITSKSDSLRFGFGRDISRTIQYVKSKSNYPVEYIYEYLLKNYNLYDLKNTFNWNCIFDDDEMAENYITEKRVVVIAHLFYPELFDYSLSYLKNVPSEFDIRITVSDKEKKKILESKIDYYGLSNTKVRLVDSRGRDLSAFLVGCRDFILDYDYVCFVHDKKSAQKEFPTVGTQFSDVLWESMLQSKNYIWRIIREFDKEKNLGMFVPLNIYHGTYFSSSTDYWTICYEKTIGIAEELGLNVKIEEDKPPISVGTVFWCKTQALEKLIRKEWKINDFPGEPLPGDGSISHALERIIPFVVQDAGYYTETVMPKDIAETENANLRYMWADTITNLRGIRGLRFDTHMNLIDSIKSLKKSGQKQIGAESPKEVVLVEIGAKRAIANYLRKKFRIGEKQCKS